jgi:replicative DNA helicase
VSLEISKKNAIFKFLTLATEVPLWKIQKKIGIDTESYIEKKQHLAKLPIYIDDSSQLTVSQIKQAIKRQFDLTGLDLVVVDYIQIVKGENTFNKNEASIIKDITSTLKGLSKQFNIPILALAQINRKGAENSEQEPTMNDFKGSGGIEEDSDVAMILHRAKNSNNDLQYLSNAGHLIIAKNRYGQTGKIGINFNGEIGKFTEDNNDTF